MMVGVTAVLTSSNHLYPWMFESPHRSDDSGQLFLTAPLLTTTMALVYVSPIDMHSPLLIGSRTLVI